jgi:alkylhydroperoxidase family enzyme
MSEDEMNRDSRTHVTGTRRRVIAGATAALIAATVSATTAQQPPGTSPRVGPVAEAERTDEQKTIAAQAAELGMPNAVGTYLHYPAVARLFVPHVSYLLNDSTLPARHRHLLALRTAVLTRSAYLWQALVPLALREGLSAADRARVAQGATAQGWDPFESALLRAADELHFDSIIADATWKALSAQYDVRQLIDTIDTVGTLTMHAGIINSLGVTPERMAPLPALAGVAATRTNMRLVGREPRIPPVEAAGGRGGGANVFRTFNRHPPADRVRGAVNTHVNSRTMTLTPRQRELLLIRIGVLCRSEYEYAAHVRVGRGAGMNDADIARILAGPDTGGDPIENELLRATGELYEDDVISAKTWTALSRAFDVRGLIDIMISVGGYRSTSMLINTAGVQLDANMEQFRFPPALR